MAPLFGGRAPKTILQTGSVIESRYRLEEIIGRGGMGVVFRAHDLPNDRPVAIKIVNLNQAIPGAREKFLREAQITLQLKHPHIVAVYELGAVDAGAPEPVPFIAMELVQGISLEYLRDLTISQVLDLGQQICDALEYAHAQGFVHRDLKPENVLVEKRGFAYFGKLADFGLARPRNQADVYYERPEGTIYYLAPEVIEGKPADVAADLYALGAVLYQMLTARVPFSDFDEQGIITQHLEEAVKPPSESRTGIPPALEALILKLLSKNPTERCSSARAVGEALAEISQTLERISPADNFPAPSPAFVADEDETLRIKELLESCRVVTLLGESNRKSSLALATGAKLMEEFSDGVWLIDLGNVQDPARVPYHVAAVLSVPESADRTLIRSLMEYLEEKNLLFILDQCDHVRGGCAQLAETILHTCPEVCILSTSREPLRLVGEECYSVPA
jgi:serine/threonine protein kinase